MTDLKNDWRAGVAVFIVGILAIGIFAITSESGEEMNARLTAQDAAREPMRDEQGALKSCQDALLRATRDPETAKVPDVGAMKGGGDWRFLWNEKSRMVRVRNGLGNEVAAVAMCVVDERTRGIKLLTLDGQMLIKPGA